MGLSTLMVAATENPAELSTNALVARVLNPGVQIFLEEMCTRFCARRTELLLAREERQKRFDAGELPAFREDTRHIREGTWSVAPVPEDILDRRVEITGPTDRKMVINALNSGARVFMADFEDSTSPTWRNILEGQANLEDANRGEITFTSPEGKFYELADRTAVLFVRPRGLHMVERHWIYNEQPMPASFFDFGTYFLNNYRTLREGGTRPYFYIPKLESHLEARLWNDIFNFAEDYVGIPRGTIRATVLIETIVAAFEMDEILYELRDHSVGLNCGRWDYIFSFIKKFHNNPDFVLPQRGDVTMEQPFLRSYVHLLIDTCHKRGAHAMGGMAAQIPIKEDAEANAAAIERVRLDKLREVAAGHDGTWVAHPGLVKVAMDVFDKHMPRPNQIETAPRLDHPVTAEDLLEIPQGKLTEEGLRRNVEVSLIYLESWLRGQGCVPIFHLMEDAATAEISRAQLWQWNRYGIKTEDGRKIDFPRIRQITDEVLQQKHATLGEDRFEKTKFSRAAELLLQLIDGPFRSFLTTELYGELA